MYRIWLEEVLGFKLRGDTLTLEPVLPADWPGFELHYRYRSSTYQIKVQRDAPFDAVSVLLEEPPVNAGKIRLSDDGLVHHVVVRLPKPLQRLLASGERAVDRPIVDSAAADGVLAGTAENSL